MYKGISSLHPAQPSKVSQCVFYLVFSPLIQEGDTITVSGEVTQKIGFLQCLVSHSISFHHVELVMINCTHVNYI